jgi:ribonuclease J
MSNKQKFYKPSDTLPLRLIPLGGMREIGKNMTIYEYGDDLIAVDCGIAFPEEDMPGVDIIIPDFTYLRENKARFRGVVLTHGHEDHIGALPWLLKEFSVPVFGDKLTMKLVERKLNDRSSGVKNPDLRLVESGMKIGLGPFTIEFIAVNHSIADANALAITTPVGIIIHSGDFKVDYTPIQGERINLQRIAEYGAKGVLLLVSESTNVEIPGTTPSERSVGETFSRVFGQAKGRIFVATFSSNVFRLQQIISAAEDHGRKVVLVGRSMLSVFDAADSLHYIDVKQDTIVDLNDADRLPDDKVVYITTGSQGEPMSALTRIAFSSHRQLEVIPGDTVILSSSAIPGNETAIYRVINELFKRGAEVIYESLADVHVSGHAYSDELRLLIALTTPHFFIPAHGEYRHMRRHALIAESMGISPDRHMILSNGEILEIRSDGLQVAGFTEGQGIPIDGSGMGDIDEYVLRDRRLLADDGVVVAVIAVDTNKNEIVTEPNIHAKGFIYESDIHQVIAGCRKRIEQVADRAKQQKRPLAQVLAGNELTDSLQRLLYEKTRRRPMILVSIVKL